MPGSTRDIKAVSHQRVTPEGTTRHGLVVGIGSYRDSRLNLTCAAQDARAVYELMIDPACGRFPQANVTLLVDEQATTASLRRALSALRRSAAEDDTVWIYYAGHGAAEGSDLYWVTHDADVDDLYGTGLAGHHIAEAMDGIASRRLLVLLDCCHAAAASVRKHQTRDVLTPEKVLECYQGKGRVTLSSSDGREKSVELTDVGHGAFTYFLAKGLRGEADEDGDGVVTLEELWSYVQSRVSEASRRAGNPQTPVFRGEMHFGLPLTLNKGVGERRVKIEAALRAMVGLDEHQLGTDEARFCLEVLNRAPRTSEESDVAGEFDALVAGQLNPRTFIKLVRLAMRARQSRSGPEPEPAVIAAPPNTDPSAPVRPVPAGADQLNELTELPKSVAAGGPGSINTLGDVYPLSPSMPDHLKPEPGAMNTLGDMYSVGDGVTRDDAVAAEWYRAAAAEGLAVAMYNLGFCYRMGRGVRQDDAQAFQWFRRAAEAGELQAMNHLGRMYDDGLGTPRDDAEAVKWYRKAAEAGNVAATSNLGQMYSGGEGVARDDAEAARLFRRAADGGYAIAMAHLASLCADGRGVPKDEAEAMKWYRKAADAGHAGAMNTIGVRYDVGRGVPCDDAEAVRWYRKSADAGNVTAMDNLGLMYAGGEGVPRDDAEAVKWHRRSAEGGHPSGMTNLARTYDDGRGVSADPAEAAKWYRKAADAGDGSAMNHLARLYDDGRGVPLDDAEAVRWYRKASNAGIVVATNNLALMYANGEGIPKDEAEAARLFLKAAQAKCAPAMYNLARAYENGRGLPRNIGEAITWYRFAADAGDSNAKKRLAEMKV